MFWLKKFGCRIFQLSFRMVLPFLPYREPKFLESCEKLDWIMEKEKLNSVLIVTDEGIVKNGLTKPVEEVLTNSGVSYQIYDKTQANPTVKNVEEALILYKRFYAQGLIAIGGGSSMDCAKAVGARVAYPAKSIGQMKGILRILRKLPPLIAIPTTAGTGSEVTLAAVITDSEKLHKYALMSFPLIPHYAVLDPVLTYSLPPHLTATTGMDALTHAVEAYIGRSTSRETRQLSEKAVKLVFNNITAAYIDGTNRDARENMLHAAYGAGIAFSKSYVGYVHAIAQSLCGQYGTPHGLANAVILPYLLDAYGKKVYKKLHKLSVCAGVANENDSNKTGVEKFIKAIQNLNKRMGIPDKIDDIRTEDIPNMAKHAEKEANTLYPVPKLMTQKELEAFYYILKEGVEENA